ncbi:flagellar basal-body rod protein FlgB [Anoxybacter fermentans]|uniref:Flagellar basal body rod protein FlgB n=2 Tax=Anoxybacter fermentans TaxID=1323375 RepID=A0A3S9T2Y7_9FIRM|nr:flagellar basal-body rod protein FlgB [Anoxybacter fermentans]
MDGAALRQKILANNVANVDTPNFKRQDINFYAQLKAMMKESSPGGFLPLARTNIKHLEGRPGSNAKGGFKVIQTTGRVREDGNNVNIDVEMAKIAENNIYYSTLASLVARKYKLLERVITKGGER